MNIDDRRPTTDRPRGPFTHFGKISNGHNSATRQPIPFMFGSRVGFSGTADRTAPFPVRSNPRWRPAAILENFKWPYLSNALSDSLCTLPSVSIRNVPDLKYYIKCDRRRCRFTWSCWRRKRLVELKCRTELSLEVESIPTIRTLSTSSSSPSRLWSRAFNRLNDYLITVDKYNLGLIRINQD